MSCWVSTEKPGGARNGCLERSGDIETGPICTTEQALFHFSQATRLLGHYTEVKKRENQLDCMTQGSSSSYTGGQRQECPAHVHLHFQATAIQGFSQNVAFPEAHHDGRRADSLIIRILTVCNDTKPLQ